MDFHELKVWLKAHELTLAIYQRVKAYADGAPPKAES
jgi:hypothetical protein